MTHDALVEQAPAKINLHLRIVSRELDGYHNLETLFQSVELHDTLDARLADATSLEVEGGIDTGPPAQNLVLRAAHAFAAIVPAAPAVAFRLTKRIPAGAGLGGGSSEAAAALRLLNTLAGGPLAPDALRELGATLGADVAFFLCGSSLAWATGRGERLEPRRPLPPATVLLVDPGFPVATRDAFGWWDDVSRAPALVPAPPPDVRSLAALRGSVYNDFEPVVFARHPELTHIRDALAASGAAITMLSGSGSCVYGLFQGDADLESAVNAVRSASPNASVLRTRTRV